MAVSTPSLFAQGVTGNMPTFYNDMKSSLTFPSAWRNSSAPFSTWQASARQEAMKCLANAQPRANDYDLKVIATEDRGNYTAEKIEFNISKWCRIQGYLLKPKSEGKVPAIVMLHDHGAHFTIGKEKMVKPFGVDQAIADDAQAWVDKCYDGTFVGDYFAQNGYAVLAIDALLWGDRGRAEGANYETQQALASNFMQMGSAWSSFIINDDLYSAEFLASLPFVDTDRIGALGFSMGAYRSWFLSAISDNIKASASVCWMNTTDQLMTTTNNQNKGGSAYSMLVPGLSRQFDYPDVASIACPKPTLLFNGNKDKLFPVAGVESAYKTMHEVWQSQGADDKLITKIWDEKHYFNKDMQAEVLQFFDKQFKATAATTATVTAMYPASNADGINIDTHLTLTFDHDITLGNKGCIKVYDAKTGKLVDKLDLSIPAGPTEWKKNAPDAIYTPVPYDYSKTGITNRNTKPGTPSGVNKPDQSNYQLTIIGGFSDAFHFYPVIVRGNTATIYLHNNLLDYGKEYYVTIDKGVINGYKGISDKKAWRFTTKAAAPDAEQRTLTVAADGTGDFSTVQGAMDFIPDHLTDESQRRTIYIKNGDYEELVYFRNKDYVTLQGESRDGVIVHYANNENFNPHPVDIKTNEVPGTFPSRRAAFAADNCCHLIFKDMTIRTDFKGQAEGLLLNGDYNYMDNIHVIGSGDALQVNGSTYWHNCIIDGDGDTILGRGPSYFNHCTITSAGAFMWIRNTEANHGNVFNDCTFHGLGEWAVIARLPDNKGKNYPHAESVLINCKLDNVPAIGWGPIGDSASTATLLEFNSRDLNDNPIDVSERHALVKQLDPVKDAETIANYSNSKFVLNW